MKAAAKYIEDTDGKLDILVNKYDPFFNNIHMVLTDLNEQCRYQRAYSRLEQIYG